MSKNSAPEWGEERSNFRRPRCIKTFLDSKPKKHSWDLSKWWRGCREREEFTRFLPMRGAHLARIMLRRWAAHLIGRRRDVVESAETADSLSHAADMHAAISQEHIADDAAMEIRSQPRLDLSLYTAVYLLWFISCIVSVSVCSSKHTVASLYLWRRGWGQFFSLFYVLARRVRLDCDCSDDGETNERAVFIDWIWREREIAAEREW